MPAKAERKLAVVSLDDGGCRTILGYGDQGAVDGALKALFRKLNATVKTVSSKQSGNARQVVLGVTIGPRTLTVTITTTPNSACPRPRRRSPWPPRRADPQPDRHAATNCAKARARWLVASFRAGSISP